MRRWRTFETSTANAFAFARTSAYYRQSALFGELAVSTRRGGRIARPRGSCAARTAAAGSGRVVRRCTGRSHSNIVPRDSSVRWRCNLYMPVLIHFLRQIRGKSTTISPDHCITKLSNFDRAWAVARVLILTIFRKVCASVASKTITDATRKKNQSTIIRR